MEATTKMTIHRALSELKLADAKIAKQISELEPVGFHQKDKKIFNHIDKDEFEKSAKGKYDSIMDLIARKNKIKSAIVKANGETMVKIAGREMTIADAINFKAIIRFKQALAAQLRGKHMGAVAQLNKNNEIIEKNVQMLLESAFGKENVAVKKDDADSIRTPYMSANEFHLFDPLSAIAKADALDTEIADFTAEVDAVLSESNAITLISID